MPAQKQITAQADEPTPDLPPTVICQSCAAENERIAVFCERCGGPIGHLSVYGPLETVLTQGHGFRNAVTHPNLITVVGMWLIFFPSVLIGIQVGIGVTQYFTTATQEPPVSLTPDAEGVMLAAIGDQDYASPAPDTLEHKIIFVAKALAALAGISLFALYVLILFKTTRNYFRRRPDSTFEDDTTAGGPE